MTIIIGENGSGKSNLKEAFKILYAIWTFENISKIANPIYGFDGQIWDGIRGGADYIEFKKTQGFKIGVNFKIKGLENSPDLEVAFSVLGKKIGIANIVCGSDLTVRNEGNVPMPSMVTKNNSRVYNTMFKNKKANLDLLQSFAAKQLDNNLGTAKGIAILTYAEEFFSNTMLLDFNIDKMREPSDLDEVDLGDKGQNLSAVLYGICRNKKFHDEINSWFRKLNSSAEYALSFRVDEYNNSVIAVIKTKAGIEFPLSVASDGTIKFLGFIAALYSHQKKLYFFEEIDTGFHPAKLGLIIRMIETLTKRFDFQVIATTHSPHLLDMLDAKTAKKSIALIKDKSTGETKSSEIGDLLNSDISKSNKLSSLHSSGWFDLVSSSRLK